MFFVVFSSEKKIWCFCLSWTCWNKCISTRNSIHFVIFPNICRGYICRGYSKCRMHKSCVCSLSCVVGPEYNVADPGSNNSTKRGRRGKIFCPTIFCSHKYHKIVNNFIFEQVKKIFLAKTFRIIVLFAQKFVIKLSKFGFGI